MTKHLKFFHSPRVSFLNDKSDVLNNAGSWLLDQPKIIKKQKRNNCCHRLKTYQHYFFLLALKTLFSDDDFLNIIHKQQVNYYQQLYLSKMIFTDMYLHKISSSISTKPIILYLEQV